jgi:hypothetical protein
MNMAFRRSIDLMAGEFGRRRFLMGALGSAAVLTHASRIFAATEFWNTKDPSTWTEDQIRILTQNSPWAKQAVRSFKGVDDPLEEGGNANPDAGGRGGGSMSHRIVTVPIFVRWETAQPILDALRAPAPADSKDHFVVSVTNLPLAIVRRPGRGDATAPDEALDRLQNGATMQVKGKDPVEAGFARRTPISSILFGFSRDYLRLSPNDREITFELDMGQMTIKAKFDGKEMVYHGKIAA